MQKRYFLSLVLATVFSISLSAQDWKIITGKYATVEYVEGFETTADSLLKIAELAIPRISKMIEVPLSSYDEQKTRIILTDAPDVTNGFAISNVVTIYATSSMYIPFWTGVTNWYQQVLTHELVHHITFRKTKRKLAIFGEVSNFSVPRWFWEGTAQYYSETWNMYRGDIFMKNAVLNGQLNYNSIAFGNDGRLLYAGGHAFTRFLAEQYGDSSLVKLMNYEPDGLMYEFDDAFKSVYGLTVPDMFQKFYRHMVLYYGDRFADYPVSKNFKELPKFGAVTDQFITLNSADSVYLVSSQKDAIHFYRTAAIVKEKNKKISVVDNLTNNYSTSLIVSSDKNLVAWGRDHVDIKNNQGTSTFDWFVYDIKNKTTNKIAADIRSRYGCFTSNNDLVLVHVNADKTVFVKYDLNGNHSEILTTQIPVGNLISGNNGNFYFDGQQTNGNRDLFVLKPDGQISLLTNDDVDDRNPIMINDSTLVFNRYEKENPAIGVYNLNSKTFRIVSNDQFEYFVTDYDNTTDKITLTGWNVNRRPVLYAIKSDSLLNMDSKPVSFTDNSIYSAWTKKFPDSGSIITLPETTLTISKRDDLFLPQNNMIHIFSIAVPDFNNDDGFGITAATNWIDPLQRQILSSYATWYFEHPENSLAYIAHTIMLWNMQFSTIWYHGPTFFSYSRDEYQKLWRDYIVIEMFKPIFIDHNPRLSSGLGISYTAYRNELLDKDYPTHFPGAPKVSGYHGLIFKGVIGYELPTRYSSFLPKRSATLYGAYFKSLTSKYDFTISEIGFSGGTNLYFERLGFKTSVVMDQRSGTPDPIQVLGVDQFYEIGIPRDFNYTRPVRGVREDINGSSLTWSSSELQLLIAEQTGLKLLFIPLDNLSISGFFDYAKVGSVPSFDKTTFSDVSVYGYGTELTAGFAGFRYGVGYAFGKLSDGCHDENVYARVKIELLGF